MATLVTSASKTKAARERRDERMNLRLPTSAKALLAEAARLAGLSLSEYVLRHSMEAAHQELSKARYKPLTEGDTAILVERLESPAAPSEGLLRAAETYRQRVRGVRE